MAVHRAAADATTFPRSRRPTAGDLSGDADSLPNAPICMIGLPVDGLRTAGSCGIPGKQQFLVPTGPGGDRRVLSRPLGLGRRFEMFFVVRIGKEGQLGRTRPSPGARPSAGRKNYSTTHS